jgi:hypothetical protein
MTDLDMLSSAAEGQVSAIAKTSGLDTTITAGWVTFTLSLDYYTKNGSPQNTFIPGLTDRVVYQSTLSGDYSDNTVKISLDSGSNLDASGVASDTIVVNGTGKNNSTYTIAGSIRKIDIQAASTYKLDGVTIPLGGSSYIPVSGTLEVTLKGKFTKTGGLQDVEKDYSFTVIITFTGSNTVKVTLPSGKQYTLDLNSGKIS